MAGTQDPIRHVVVLMLENRSFDQMLGDLRRVNPDIDGIDRARPGKNLDPTTQRNVAQAPIAEYSLPSGVDIGHEPENVDRQIATDTTPMSGFVEDFRKTNPGADDALAAQVMAYFPIGDSPAGDALPALHGLARQFVVCDRWFSSLPGPTWPNRLFALTGTSAGTRHMPDSSHPTVAPWTYGQQTIFDRFSDKGIKARVFSEGLSMTSILRRMWLHPSWRDDFEGDFLELAAGAEENFPAFSWVEPDYFGGDSSDQHPPHDVRRGDELIARVYNALRANDALWTRTLLIVTHDEHGGFYDHVIPPSATSPDDGEEDGFRFDRLGVRVPALLISPWLARAACHVVFDHTSVLRYVSDKWGLDPLGRRAATANSIGQGLIFTAQPRTDTPETLPLPRTRSLATPKETSLNSNQDALLRSIEMQQAELMPPSQRGLSRALARSTGTPLQRQVRAKAAYEALDTHYRDVETERTVRVLIVHGVGHGDADRTWRDRWTSAITAQIREQPGASQWIIEPEFAIYDDIFERYPLGPKEIASALIRMTGGLLVGTPGGANRGLFDALSSIDDKLRWTAGMIVQWVDEPTLRDALCTRLAEHIAHAQPDFIAAHSLGSLVSYDYLRREVAAGRAAAQNERVLMTFGSQIAHPAVVPVFDGRVEPLHDDAGNGIEHWFHLYNSRDHVFTRPLPLADAKTTNLLSDFDVPDDPLNHDGAFYLARPESLPVWQDLTATTRTFRPRPDASFGATAPQSITAPAIARSQPSRNRALLVGINNYPDAQNRLQGCINDTFLISSVLQEYDIKADDIRLLLDERATRQGISDRLEWLVDGMQPGDRRVFFYSGHGAQIPSYGVNAEPDGLDETLVPYDFDWSREKAFTDDQFHKFYSQLPYDSHLLCIFDCCHAGGLTRGMPRTRGLDPPDDVRHRSLRWDKPEQMWVPRDWVPSGPRTNRLFARSTGQTGDQCNRRFLGQATLTRGASIAPERARGQTRASTPMRSRAQTRKIYGHKGPFMPLLLYACGENQLASEYDHGSVAYGAFTFVLAKTMRETRARPSESALETVIKQASDTLATLGYQQKPEFVGASSKYPADTHLGDIVGTPARGKPARRKSRAK